MMPASFKDAREIWTIPVTFLPKKFTLENFETLFTPQYDFNFFTSMWITLGVTLCGVVLSLAVNMMAAYVFARLEFRGKKILWPYCIFMMFVPGLAILLTAFQVVLAFGMIDTVWVLILPGVANSYSIFFFRQFMLGVPQSLEEAALIDGASRFRIFLTLFVPLSVSPMVIIGVGTFMGYWNNFVWPTLTIFENVKLKQVMQVLYSLNYRYPTRYGVVIAASLFS